MVKSERVSDPSDTMKNELVKSVDIVRVDIVRVVVEERE